MSDTSQVKLGYIICDDSQPVTWTPLNDGPCKLKLPKHEIFVAVFFFKQPKPVRVDYLGTRQ